MGRKTTLKKPLTADATLGSNGHCDVGGVGQVGVVGKRLSDLLKNSKDSVLDLTSREVVVKPNREVIKTPTRGRLCKGVDGRAS